MKKNESNSWAAYENDEPHSGIPCYLTNDKEGESTLKGAQGSKRILYENHFNLGSGPKGVHYRLLRVEYE